MSFIVNIMIELGTTAIKLAGDIIQLVGNTLIWLLEQI